MFFNIIFRFVPRPVRQCLLDGSGGGCWARGNSSGDNGDVEKKSKSADSRCRRRKRSDATISLQLYRRTPRVQSRSRAPLPSAVERQGSPAILGSSRRECRVDWINRICHRQASASRSAARTWSGVIGNSRTRAPVAANTAFAIAGPVVASPSSPTPLGGLSLDNALT